MIKAEFKIGDEVRVTKSTDWFKKGDLLVIDDLSSPIPYAIALEGPRKGQRWAISQDKIELVVEATRTEKEITIDNLRELARHTENWKGKYFDMQHYLATRGDAVPRNDRRRAYRSLEKVRPECGTTCCLIGIADAKGMGDTKVHSELGWGDAKDHSELGWEDYAVHLFPALWPEGRPQWIANSTPFQYLFGMDLKSKIKRRVKGLRLAANMLEMDGKIDYSKLPD